MDTKAQKKIRVAQSQEIIQWYNKLTKEEQDFWDWGVSLGSDEREILSKIFELEPEVRTVAMQFFRNLVRWKWAGKSFIYVLTGTVLILTSLVTIYNFMFSTVLGK